MRAYITAPFICGIIVNTPWLIGVVKKFCGGGRVAYFQPKPLLVFDKVGPSPTNS
jgi:hypothetical protein